MFSVSDSTKLLGLPESCLSYLSFLAIHNAAAYSPLLCPNHITHPSNTILEILLVSYSLSLHCILAPIYHFIM